MTRATMTLFLIVVFGSVSLYAAGARGTEPGDAREVQKQILTCNDQSAALSLWEKLQDTRITDDVHAWVRAAEDPSKLMIVRAISMAAACDRFIRPGDDLRDVVQRMGNASWWQPSNLEELTVLGGRDPFPDGYPTDQTFIVNLPGTSGRDVNRRYWVWIQVRPKEPISADLTKEMGRPKAEVPLTVHGVRPLEINYFPPYPATMPSDGDASTPPEQITIVGADREAGWVRRAAGLWKVEASGKHALRQMIPDGQLRAVDVASGIALCDTDEVGIARIVGLNDGATVARIRLGASCIYAAPIEGGLAEARFVVGILGEDPVLHQATIPCALVLKSRKGWSIVSPPEANAFSVLEDPLGRSYADGGYWCAMVSIGDPDQLSRCGYALAPGNAKYREYIAAYLKDASSSYNCITAFSSSGKRFAWRCLPGPSRPLGFSADGKSLALCRGSQDGVVFEKADLTTGDTTPMVHPFGLITPVAVSADMNTVVGMVSAGAEYSPARCDLAVWDGKEEPVRVVRMDAEGRASAAVLDSDIWCSDEWRIYHLFRGTKGRWELENREGIALPNEPPTGAAHN